MTDRRPDGRTGDRADGLGERELRRLLHHAVADLEPDPGALPRLRYAVPRRRARHRNAWTGAAAAVLTMIAAVPALQGVEQFDLSGGTAGGPGSAVSADGHPEASRSAAFGATPLHHVPASFPADSQAPSGPAPAGPPTTGGAGGPTAVPAPPCTRADLGRAESGLSPAGTDGRVYGWFTVHNTAGQGCRLAEPGVLTVNDAVGTDAANVKVLRHAAGDGADALPDPGTAARELLLPPGGGYRIRFGWVPGRACTVPGGASAAPSGQGVAVAGPEGSPKPGDGGGAPGVPGSGASPTPTATPSPAPTPTGPTRVEPTVTLGYAPVAGGPGAAAVVLKSACEGTVYQAAPEALPGTTPPDPAATTG
ncbi:hypothetical protein [Kitasatospora camelliae]|uniref:DUF4232 domain-containing protein n=1 Tax=Kitasatospora camelliae TaxID=3156397 RepID=A0AAU8JXB4_9ACTN